MNVFFSCSSGGLSEHHDWMWKLQCLQWPQGNRDLELFISFIKPISYDCIVFRLHTIFRCHCHHHSMTPFGTYIHSLCKPLDPLHDFFQIHTSRSLQEQVLKGEQSNKQTDGQTDRQTDRQTNCYESKCLSKRGAPTSLASPLGLPLDVSIETRHITCMLLLI